MKSQLRQGETQIFQTNMKRNFDQTETNPGQTFMTRNESWENNFVLQNETKYKIIGRYAKKSIQIRPKRNLDQISYETKTTINGQ